MGADPAIIAAAAAHVHAIKASGVVVKLEPAAFLNILSRIEVPLIVMAEGGMFHTYHHYLTSYRGLAFFTKSHDALTLPATAELIVAESIWIPDM